MAYISSNGILFSHLQQLGWHYASWNKPDTERKILHDHVYVESEKVKTHRNRVK